MVVRGDGETLAVGRRSIWVRRQRVIDLLAASRHVPVVSVEAPGGYGKTTALHQWVEQDPRPVVWRTVRPQAPDPTWLATEIVEGLTAAGLLPDRVRLPTAADPTAWYLGLLPVLERALSAVAEPFLLVVDEAGALSGPLWDALAASLATSLPTGAQLVLASRTEPPAALRKLRSSGRIATVGPADLALDPVEGAELVAALGLHLDDDTVFALLEQTEGWPIALPLVASALRRGGQDLRRQRLVTTSELADYLRHEVLDALPADDRRFLLRGSVLPELDEASCDAVAETSGSLGRLRRLTARTYLLTSLDAGAERFRLHPLLSAFLRDELHAVDPAAERAAHAAAASVRERAGDLDAAAFHAAHAGDDAGFAALVWRHTATLLATGRTAVLRRWLERIPHDRLVAQPPLALAAAWVASHEGDLSRMRHLGLVARAEAARSQPEFLAEVGLLEATIGDDGLAGTASLAAAYVAARPADDVWLTLAYFLLGVVESLLGDVAAARRDLERGDRLADAHGLSLMAAHSLTGLADLALFRGDEATALSRISSARRLMDRDRLDFIVTTAPVFTTSTFGYLLQGRLPEARREAARALRLTSLITRMAPWHAAQGRLRLARVYLSLGDSTLARQLLAEADAAAEALEQSPVLAALSRELHELLDTGAPPAAATALTTAELRVLQYLPTHLTFPEIAAKLYVSRHTVKTQALAVYRKLGAHSRNEAIERARELGLLPTR